MLRTLKKMGRTLAGSWATPFGITLVLTLAAYSCRPGEIQPIPNAQPYVHEDALSDRDVQRPIPEKPLDWQKKPKGNPPKCGAKEFLINGACYRRAHPDDYSPPCEAPTVEYRGTCYYFVEAAPKTPSSIER